MARINIEEKLFSDQRWMDLLVKTGCRHKALGILCSAWMLAQKNWLQYGMIPAKAWSKDLDVLIDVELATRRSDGNIYIKGSKRAFAWLDQRSEAGSIGGEVKSRRKSAAARENGKKGGRPSLPEKPTDALGFFEEKSQPDESKSISILQGEEPKRDATERNGTQRNATSLSYSYSSSYSNSDSVSNSEDLILSKLGSEKSSRRSNRADKSGSHGCITELSDDPVCFELLATSTSSAQKAWLEAYPSPEFVKQECRRAKAWIESNPQKRPKNFQRFFANWLSRAFESYRKGLKSRPLTSAEVNAMSLNELWEKNERGEL